MCSAHPSAKIRIAALPSSLAQFFLVGAVATTLAQSAAELDPSATYSIGELSGLQVPGDLVSTEDDAGRHRLRAGQLE